MCILFLFCIKKIAACVIAVLIAFSGWIRCDRNRPDKPLAERIGVTYWGAAYEPFADTYGTGIASAIAQLKALGTKVTKLSTLAMEDNYRFDDWSGYPLDSLVNVLKHPTCRQLLDDAFFTSYFLSAYETNNVVWWDGLDAAEKSYVIASFYDAALYLLTEYAGTGKTFILQNWEADNALGYVYNEFPGTSVQGMTDYFNARQAGILLARQEAGRKGVFVYGGIEVNFLKLSPPGGAPRVADAIVPHTNADIYLYSCWETKDKWDIGDNGEAANLAAIRTAVTQALTYLTEKAPASVYFGEKNVAISEFGYPALGGERSHPGLVGDDWQRMVTQATLEAGLEFGAHYMVYWELYCNDPFIPIVDPTNVRNADMNGYWLIRPDGTKSAAYDYIQNLLKRDADRKAHQ
ncbi:MAG: hypothetical protein LBC83_07975 [Oscillospiraceae bacterium]|jgi:hypothetical protein|nr:hypothetical protein [Oscillospiraceae bacterium]